MLLIISPSKTQQLNGRTIEEWTQPQFISQVRELAEILAGMADDELASLMKISPRLAESTYARYQKMSFPFTRENSRQSLLVFHGAQYDSITTEQYDQEDFSFAQGHLRILSGLYGVLRPLDLIQPYRLEMATRLTTDRGTTLYDFWGELIAENINGLLACDKKPVLVNLASDEYFKAVRAVNLDYPVLRIVFKEIKNGKAGVIAVYAKRARGMMVDYVIRQRITEPELLKKFNRKGYRYTEELSTAREWVFARRRQ